MCTVVDSGRDNGPPFLMYGYVTLMRTRTKSLAPNRYTNCTKTKRSESMHLDQNNRSREWHFYAFGIHYIRRYVSGVSAVPFQACRAHLFKEAGGLRNNNRMDQNEGILRHPADCPSLFERNKVTEKKDKCTGE